MLEVSRRSELSHHLADNRQKIVCVCDSQFARVGRDLSPQLTKMNIFFLFIYKCGLIVSISSVNRDAQPLPFMILLMRSTPNGNTIINLAI